MVLCESYFKIEEKIIDGFRVVKESEKFKIYVYTSCKKLNNWQLFLEYKNLKQVKLYFEKSLQSRLEELDQSIEWNKKEIKFIGSIVKAL